MSYRIGTVSEGSQLSGRLRGVCECGWSGPWHAGLSDSVAEVEQDVVDHAGSHKGGAKRAPFYVRSALGVGYHVACGHHHSLADDCPLAPGTPEGMVRAMFAPTMGDPEQVKSCLQSIVALSNLVQGQGVHAALELRRLGVSWEVVEQLCAPLRFGLPEKWVRDARALAACLYPAGEDAAAEQSESTLSLS